MMHGHMDVKEERMVFILAGLHFGWSCSITTPTLHNGVHSMYFVRCYKTIPHKKWST